MYARIFSTHTGDHIGAAEMMLSKFLNKSAKGRWRGCSYCTYYQRPNLTEGEFQAIMPGEDEKAFEIFQEIVDRVPSYLILVLSAKASDSIKKLAGDNLPKNIHFFDSPYPSQWTEQAREEFKNAVEDITCEWCKDYIEDWANVSGMEDGYFTRAIDDVINGVGTQKIKSMTRIDGVDELINSNAEYILRCNPLNIKDYEKVFLPFGKRPKKYLKSLSRFLGSMPILLKLKQTRYFHYF